MREKPAEPKPLPPERALVVRLWPATQAAAAPQWRIVVQDATTHERRGFASLEDFFLFIEQLCSTANKD